MKIKFANCEVDVWKLRKGVVLMDFCGVFYHLDNFASTPFRGIVNLQISNNFGEVEYLSTELDWCEPH